MVDVVAGLAIRDGLVLLGLRKPGGKRPSLWEMPGGKVEPGESHSLALQREWKEELGIDFVAVGPLLGTASLDLEVPFTVHLYQVEILHRVVPQPLDHSELRWVALKEAVEHMPCSPALYMHYPKVRDFLGDKLRERPW